MKHILTDKTILLASKSPRRRDLIKQLNVAYKIIEADVPEVLPASIGTHDAAQYLAELKTHLDYSLQPNDILLTADTVVIHKNTIIGKPKSKNDAMQILHKLSNDVHTVISGVCMRSLEQKISFSVHTEIEFYPLTELEINHYVSQYEVMDKAGAYAIQEWIGLVGVKRLHGCYYNVMGLPVSAIVQQLKSF